LTIFLLREYNAGITTWFWRVIVIAVTAGTKK
jgi:hypothetical protein